MKFEKVLKNKDLIKANQPIADKTVRVLANSIYQTLREEGCQNKDIIGVSSQLIGLVTSAMQADHKPSEG